MSQYVRNENGEWVNASDRTDPFGNSVGWTDGNGAVDMGDGMFIPTDTFDTIRLPDELGGEWCAVMDSHMIRLPDGRIGRYHILAHPTVDCISLRNGDGALWVRKQNTQEGDEQE